MKLDHQKLQLTLQGYHENPNCFVHAAEIQNEDQIVLASSEMADRDSLRLIELQMPDIRRIKMDVISDEYGDHDNMLIPVNFDE